MNVSAYQLYQGDCRDVMGLVLGDNSVDAVVTDPPYHLTTGKKGGSGLASVNLESPYGRARVTTGFMGMKWDGGDVAMDPDTWRTVLDVLKPGGYLLAFAGTRTYHRIACAIEDAGFEIRDQLQWIYGSGFPKSHNGEWGGTALKPAHEPIVMARKPIVGTVADNFARWGTGGLAIDGCRIETDENLNGGAYAKNGQPRITDDWRFRRNQKLEFVQPTGRWPANVMHDGSDEVVALFPETTSGAMKREVEAYAGGRSGPSNQHGDTGSAARFFYYSKASRKDRNEGCEANVHPTVKPTELMRYLCRLVTPPDGVVLDPFMGSGSTGKAALLEGLRFIGIEREEAYMAIARARIEVAA